MKRIVVLILIVCSFFSYRAHAVQSENSTSFSDLFDELCGIIEEHFVDPIFIQERFPELKTKYRERAQLIKTSNEFSKLANEMLSHFGVSHTYYLTPNDYEYYHLADIFSFLPQIKELFNQKEILYPTIGVITKSIDRKQFIASVLAGGPAKQAGLLSGDEIVDVNGKPYQPIESIIEHVGQPVTLAIKRHPETKIEHFVVTPVLINPKKEMLEAQKTSVELIKNQGKKIGYIHIYSYAGEEYHKELISAISGGALNKSDALVIDLRYGLGGADPSYLNIFNTKIPVVTMIDNKGDVHQYDPQWRKPTAILVNEATRSGKEIFAFGAQKYKLATLVGERTAGATTGARLFPLSNRDLLYLAGRTGEIDGVDLEGVGVEPDIEVQMDLRYQAGKDIQLERAIEYLVELLNQQP
jgi:carboxyl-terminal processing protease